ncbi:MAG: hypothetical protein K0S32_3613 [Bacteroidetes bacterium]|jgi:hypothetical protein|nr:hypothetical protein [Bacteroidota bacterium]
MDLFLTGTLKRITVLLLTVQFFTIYGQSSKVPEADVKAKWKYFSKYSDAQKKTINDNWGLFFKEDVMSVLNPTLNVYPIKLDSYGLFYPESDILSQITEENFSGVIKKYSDNRKFSFYQLFLTEKVRTIISKLPDGENKKFYDELLTHVNKKILDDENIRQFNKKWNDFHIKKQIAALKAKINNGSFKHVIFFIHGYNVPYSLANIQTIELANIVDSLQKNSVVPQEKILYVPVLWPSNAQKKHNFSSLAAFNTEDISGVFNGGAKNGFRFQYFSNRAYYAGITIRKTINGLENENVKVSIYSHSLGGVAGASILINPISKLHTDYYDVVRNFATERLNNTNKFKEFKRKEPVNYEITENFHDEPVPTRPVNVFFSAGAIPGTTTFTDMPASSSNKKFYCTINRNDRMVTKNGIRIWIIKPVNAAQLNATTLGCDYKGEINNTANVFNAKFGNANNFIASVASTKTDHDILTYMQQPDYINLIARFLNGN